MPRSVASTMCPARTVCCSPGSPRLAIDLAAIAAALIGFRKSCPRMPRNRLRDRVIIFVYCTTDSATD